MKQFTFLLLIIISLKSFSQVESNKLLGNWCACLEGDQIFGDNDTLAFKKVKNDTLCKNYYLSFDRNYYKSLVFSFSRMGTLTVTYEDTGEGSVSSGFIDEEIENDSLAKTNYSKNKERVYIQRPLFMNDSYSDYGYFKDKAEITFYINNQFRRYKILKLSKHKMKLVLMK